MFTYQCLPMGKPSWSIDLGAVGRRRLGDAARQRIEAQFDLDTIVKQYERCYDELAACSVETS
jgi:glycosyltransferase involved in cell wall biosynthesis